MSSVTGLESAYARYTSAHWKWLKAKPQDKKKTLGEFLAAQLAYQRAGGRFPGEKDEVSNSNKPSPANATTGNGDRLWVQVWDNRTGDGGRWDGRRFIPGYYFTVREKRKRKPFADYSTDGSANVPAAKPRRSTSAGGGKSVDGKGAAATAHGESEAIPTQTHLPLGET